MIKEYIFDCLLEMADGVPLRGLTKILIELKIPETKRNLVEEIIKNCYNIIVTEDCNENKCIDNATKKIQELGGDVK